MINTIVFWKVVREFQGHERKKRKTLHHNLIRYSPWARAAPLEREQFAAPNATGEARFW